MKSGQVGLKRKWSRNLRMNGDVRFTYNSIRDFQMNCVHIMRFYACLMSSSFPVFHLQIHNRFLLYYEQNKNPVQSYVRGMFMMLDCLFYHQAKEDNKRESR